MNALKELRLQKKLTQKEVADAIGVSLRSYVS
ncbi:MAG: helix-turn-helix transcriptional regulator, partial [Clostridia bacterium]|nr:helix-turn-helix transcriptional regulator [Clostridia bacterium]